MVKRKQTYRDDITEAETIIIRDDGLLTDHWGAPFRGLEDGVTYDVISYAAEGFMKRIDTIEDLKTVLRDHKMAMWRTKRACKFSSSDVVAQGMQPRREYVSPVCAKTRDIYSWAVDSGALD